MLCISNALQCLHYVRVLQYKWEAFWSLHLFRASRQGRSHEDLGVRAGGSDGKDVCCDFGVACVIQSTDLCILRNWFDVVSSPPDVGQLECV